MSHLRSSPVDPLLSPPLEDLDHVRGERGAPLELVMFGDFQCPFCLGAQSILRRVRERLGGRVLVGVPPPPVPPRPPPGPLGPPGGEGPAGPGPLLEYPHTPLAAHPEPSPGAM